MFAIGHAATALIIKRKFPIVPLTPILLSVQFMELVWVGANYLGVEHLTTENTVRSVADVHLADMPWSHSIAVPIIAALIAWRFLKGQLGLAVGVGILSHLVLDLIMHGHDIPLAPGLESIKFGLGLYEFSPLASFAVELLYGIACWWVYRGSQSLLALIVIANLMNLSFLSVDLPGLEMLLAGKPMWIVTIVAVQTVVTLYLTHRFAHTTAPSAISPANTRAPQPQTQP